MPFDYTAFDVDLSDPDSCLEFVTASLSAFGLTLPSDAALKLELSAGIDPDGVKVYRPYGYAARVLARAKNTKHLLSGRGGVTFRDADKTINEWRDEQAEIDAIRLLILPPGAAIGLADELVYSGPVRMVFRV